MCGVSLLCLHTGKNFCLGFLYSFVLVAMPVTAMISEFSPNLLLLYDLGNSLNVVLDFHRNFPQCGIK